MLGSIFQPTGYVGTNNITLNDTVYVDVHVHVTCPHILSESCMYVYSPLLGGC